MPDKVVTVQPGPVRGEIRVPGDKSISHRALIAGAAGTKPLRVVNLNPGRDVLATRNALAALGARIDARDGAHVVSGGGLATSAATLDCMNSGSTVRMLLGACAGAGIAATFDGDSSLRRRPMEPVAAQLRAFGAQIETAGGSLPLRLRARGQIETRHFILLAPSAQVKSALLFAGLFSGVAVQVDGDRGSRDHTERLLRYLGCEIEWNGQSVRLGRVALARSEVEVPGDFSAAAFLITAAALTPGSDLLVRNVGLNPTRTGLLDALRSMGARAQVRNHRIHCGEPVGDVRVAWQPLRATIVAPDTALRAIDEIPLLAMAAAFAEGTTTISGVAELRSKESDRIAATERLLAAVGISVTYDRGTLAIAGGRPAADTDPVATLGDHRIAMAAAVLGRAAGPLSLDSDESLDVSFPGFLEVLEGLRAS
ncbi:MAG TPA: 3-phosphoshikimate 1-carboxyvinyltransferase [Candidatus Cybelea sp.]|jgi:3-phosphoshikimate 1-carboxyvinyltransferase|nr:3-phosphoshikimate 1-carboxyvinyltransferase [Candidatus Cybelea sp.]